jgi:hypothetical protein
MARLGDYDIEGVIGRGSVGMVHQARQRAGDHVVALKRVRWVGDGREVERLRAELAGLVRLGHPHVLTVIELLADENGIAVAMDLAPGGSLAEVLARRGRLPPEEGAALAAKVADALAAAHSLEVVHGDVKPSNVLMDGAGEPLLSDFGLSRSMAAASPLDGATMGTAEYLDPAVAAGATPGPASDIYSLGIVSYELLAGRLPYSGVTPAATLRAAHRARAEPLVESRAGVPVGLAAVVEQAMSRRPQDRPATARQLADALRAEMNGHGTTHAATGGWVGPMSNGTAAGVDRATGPRTIRPRRRSSEPRLEIPAPGRRPAMRLVVLVGVAAVLVVLSSSGWAFGRGSRGGAGSSCGTRPTAGRGQHAPANEGVTVLADVAGNGCRVPVVGSSGVVTVSLTSRTEPVRFALGQLGDRLLLGDWDCRGRAKPALYRPATGEVFYYDGWAQPGQGLAPSRQELTRITEGVPRAVRDRDQGCDRVEVGRPGGAPVRKESP